jgi:hypothetical protein
MDVFGCKIIQKKESFFADLMTSMHDFLRTTLENFIVLFFSHLAKLRVMRPDFFLVNKNKK